ncbi:951_t:CDS:2 [Paraglomus brasilianum]|uniref:951_t:CDS:1 n=1 Tax=Paraglomus brasilianum TaxID=144538 RepID=A0A9N9G0M4_9GLOM|nr:951_t:CDS:2 [Paraglomus brasilianum]
MKCGKSHDLDLILDYEAEQEDRRKHHKFDSTLKISIKDGDSSADVSPRHHRPRWRLNICHYDFLPIAEEITTSYDEAPNVPPRNRIS